MSLSVVVKIEIPRGLFGLFFLFVCLFVCVFGVFLLVFWTTKGCLVLFVLFGF